MNGTSAQAYIQRLYPAQAANMIAYNNQTQLLEDLLRQKISAYVNDKGYSGGRVEFLYAYIIC